MDTPIFGYGRGLTREEIDSMWRAVASEYPLRRAGHVDDVARAIVFLASEDASWITGTLLPVDGGITQAPQLPWGNN